MRHPMANLQQVFMRGLLTYRMKMFFGKHKLPQHDSFECLCENSGWPQILSNLSPRSVKPKYEQLAASCPECRKSLTQSEATAPGYRFFSVTDLIISK